MKRTLAALAAAAALAAPAHAADRIKVGFISTLSGPNASIGTDIRDGFNLAVKLAGGKIGGLPAEVTVLDDQLNPETAKQHAERLIKRDRVDVVTGTVFSNIVLAVAPAAVEGKTIFISPNAAPSQLAGANCTPWFFVSSWPSDAINEAAGQFATQKGFKNVLLLTPNYAGGKDAMTGYKRYFKGRVVDEIYTKLGQLDYSAELGQIRAAKPEALYVFLPGGMGINFVKQFVATGLSKDVQLIVPVWSVDQDIIRAVGDPVLGTFNTAHWSIDFDNPASKKFVAEFEKEYKRLPTTYASQGYDTALLLDAAVRRAKGKIEDREAFRQAIRAGDFRSVRGPFKFNTNQYPIQNYYLEVVGKGTDGKIVNKTMGTVFTNHGDAYAKDCKMK
jgi:branched-chain amino acid transport system substrate-binding protein